MLVAATEITVGVVFGLGAGFAVVAGDAADDVSFANGEWEVLVIEDEFEGGLVVSLPSLGPADVV